MELLYGSEYQEGYLVFSVLLFSSFIFSLREVYGYGLIAWNNEKNYTKIVGITSLINIVLNLIFLPLFGILAAAFTTVLSELINFILMKRISDKIINVKIDKLFLLKVVVANILLGVIVLIMKVFTASVIFILLISLTLYIALIFVLRIYNLSKIKDAMI
jgi:O-antigen/teichoic acid export membrane protein